VALAPESQLTEYLRMLECPGRPGRSVSTWAWPPETPERPPGHRFWWWFVEATGPMKTPKIGRSRVKSPSAAGPKALPGR
jgi:hypothetical protein